MMPLILCRGNGQVISGQDTFPSSDSSCQIIFPYTLELSDANMGKDREITK
jgi:hypothetical protein